MGRSTQRQTNQFAVPHRTWPFVTGVATLALGAGVLIAGVPQSSEAFVMPADVTTTTWGAGQAATVGDLGIIATGTADGTAAVASAAPVPSTVVTTIPVTSIPVTSIPVTTVPTTTIPVVTVPTSPATSIPTASTPVTTVERTVVTTTVAATMSASAGTVPPPTTTPTTTPTSTARDGSAETAGAATVEPARVSIVVVNGADEAGLAGRTARSLAAKGYTSTDTTDALRRADRTTVFYAPGFEDEAAVLAEAMGLWAPLQPMPATAITVNGAEADADLVLLLGPTS